ncbi:hypothetical protein IJ425_02785 [bacterium]|nr:hypothetical protein [bacterium]
MEKEKVKFLKEKQVQKCAQETAELLESKFAQNPIKTKFDAFRHAKKTITIKDLF